MADFTEEELDRAISGGEETPANDLATDLAEQPTEPEQPAEQPTEPETEQPTEPEEPATTPQEGENPQEPAEKDVATEQEQPATEPATEEEPKLILGKFKTQEDLEKAYQNLEKRFGEKAQEVKQVEQVSSDDFDTAVRYKVAEENWKLVEKAFDTIAKPEDYKEAQFLLSQFKRTGDVTIFEKARGFLDPRIDRRLEVDTMNNEARIWQQANAHKKEILMKPVVDELDKMAEEDPEFMNDQQNQQLLAMAIQLNPSTVDVRAVKKAIEEYRKLSYQKGFDAAKKEAAKQAEKKAVPIKSTGHIEKPKPKKDYDSMSVAEQLAEEYKDIPLL